MPYHGKYPGAATGLRFYSSLFLLHRRHACMFLSVHSRVAVFCCVDARWLLARRLPMRLPTTVATLLFFYSSFKMFPRVDYEIYVWFVFVFFFVFFFCAEATCTCTCESKYSKVIMLLNGYLVFSAVFIFCCKNTTEMLCYSLAQRRQFIDDRKKQHQVQTAHDKNTTPGRPHPLR